MNTLILGIGNLLLKDEGVGIHAVRALEKEKLPADVDLLDGGTGGFHLIGRLEEYDRIILIDATLDEHPPGTVRLIKPQYASDFPPLMSAHEIGLKDMLNVMQLTDTLPLFYLIVVSVSDVGEVGLELSPEVEGAIPEVMAVARSLIKN